MPYIKSAERDALVSELSRIRTQWTFIQKFLADEDEALQPIYKRWLEAQKANQS